MSEKISVSDYGYKIKARLLEMRRNQNWLIERIREIEPEMYIDSSVLGKILVGKITSGRVVSAINEILGFEDTTT